MRKPSTFSCRLLLSLAALLGIPAVAAPTLTQQPAATVIATSGQAAIFSAQATGTGSLRWQWRRVGVALAGQTGATLTLPAATMADAGFYDVVVTDDTGSTTSAPGRLMITPADGYRNTFRLDTSFRPTFEKDGANITSLAVAPGGEVYVAGNFVGIAGAARTGLARFTADLALDPTYTPHLISSCTALAIQPDGKLIVSATAHLGDGSATGPLVRLLVDGTIAPPFSAPVLGPYNTPGKACVAAVLPDGKILVTGSFTSVGTFARSGLARLNSDGSVDTSFTAQLGQSPGISRVARSGDKIVVRGTFSGPSGPARSLIRLNSDGSEDTSFTPGASIPTGWGPLAVDSAGRVYTNGMRTPGGLYETLRLLPDGSVDATFTTYPETNTDTIALLPDGRFVATWWYGSDPMFGTFAADGSLESSLRLAESASTLPARLVIAPDGSIYAGGSYSYGPFIGGVAHLSAGSEVISAAPAGLISSTMPQAVHPATGGKWLVGGDFTYVNGIARQGLVRLNADGTTDTTFVPDCWGFQVSKIAVQGDGAILTMGPKRPHALRFLPDGQRDPTFPFSARRNFASIDRFIALPDGRMALMAWLSGWYDYQSLDTSVLLLQPDGAADPTSPSLLRAGFNISNTMTEAVGGGFVAAGSLQAATGTLSLLWQNRFGETVFPQSNSPLLPPLSTVCFDSNGTLVAISRNTSEVFRFNPQGTITSTKSSPTLTAYIPAASYPQTDGKVLLAATAAPGSERFGPLVRLNTDDTIDTAFRIADLTGMSGIFPYTDLHYTDNGRLLICGAYGARDGIEQNGLALFIPETLPPAPSIARQPASLNVPAGGNATFEVEATGTITSYRWYKDSTLWTTTTVPRLSLSQIAPDAYGVYTVEVVGPGGIACSQAFVLGLAPAAVPFSAWIAASNAPEGQRGALDTPAHDGIANLLKYALGVPPLADARAHLPVPSLHSAGGQPAVLALVFARNPAAQGIRCVLETSTDLATWTEAASITDLLGTNPDGTELVRLRETVATTGARRFARLKVIPTNP